MDLDEALSQPHRAGPLPPALSTAPVTRVKRRRTLTTSSCGPDLHQALAELVADRLNTNAGQPELTQYYEDQFLNGPVQWSVLQSLTAPMPVQSPITHRLSVLR